jgi:hypothetical protein
MLDHRPGDLTVRLALAQLISLDPAKREEATRISI